MTVKARLIYNPTAGPWEKRRLLRRLQERLRGQDWLTEIVETEKPGDATRLAREAADAGYDVVLVAGGDGTSNEAVNGLVHTETALGLVPVGTGNILAHQLEMPILTATPPTHLAEVARALTRGRFQRIDVGKYDDRHFVCWAGVGLDAEIAAQMEPRPRYAKRLRALPYVIAAFSVAQEFRGMRTRITVEDKKINTRALLVLVSNIRLYAAFFNVARNAHMDDGMLDVFVFQGLGFNYFLEHLLHIFSGRYLRDPSVIQILTKSIKIETTPEVAVHLDGEPYHETPIHVSLVPGALRLLVPRQAPDALFSKSPEATLGE
jgi:YegS/Rv2252/BmrU family lipid kinase